MQALANINGCNIDINAPLNAPIFEPMTVVSNPSSTPNTTSVALDQRSWTMAERIGGKISIDLANGSSANNSGRGSRSSGLQATIV